MKKYLLVLLFVSSAPVLLLAQNTKSSQNKLTEKSIDGKVVIKKNEVSKKNIKKENAKQGESNIKVEDNSNAKGVLYNGYYKPVVLKKEEESNQPK